MILASLPPLFLVCKASRVCKGFRTTIKTSPTLQRKIFRAPDSKGGQRVLLDMTDAFDLSMRNSGPRCDLQMRSYNDKYRCLLVKYANLCAI